MLLIQLQKSFAVVCLIKQIGGSMLKSVEGGLLKFGGFLVVLGLVLGLWMGLWMGFNPQTHRQVTRSLDTTKAFFVKIQTDISTTTHKWVSQFKVREKATAPSKNTPQPGATIWRQISDFFAGLWKSLQKTWLRIISRLHIS